MIYLYMADGSYGEVPGAGTAAIEGELFVCRGPDEQIVALYPRLSILAFSLNPLMGDLIHDACMGITFSDEETNRQTYGYEL